MNTDDNSGRDSSEINGWTWLLIGMTIGFVVGLVGCLGYLKLIQDGNKMYKQVAYDSGTPEHLLASDDGDNNQNIHYQKMEE